MLMLPPSVSKQKSYDIKYSFVITVVSVRVYTISSVVTALAFVLSIVFVTVPSSNVFSVTTASYSSAE